MPSLKQTKTRIKSVQTTAKITKAMQAIAAMRLKKFEKKAKAVAEYSNNLQKALNTAISSLNSPIPALLGNPSGKILVVLVAPTRGFCGGLHRTCVTETAKFFASQDLDIIDNSQFEFVVINKPGHRVLSKIGCKIKASFFGPYKDISTYSLLPISELVYRLWLSGEYSQVFVSYARASSALKPFVIIDKILPFAPDLSLQELNPVNTDTGLESVIDEGLPLLTHAAIHNGVLATQSAEEGARMVAMAQATDNAKSLTKKLQLVYFRQRQAKITQEISEIIGGSL